MAKTKIKDIVVILPGITGSVLQKDGKDFWGASARAIFELIKSGGKNLQQLKLEGEDSKGDYYGDGIKANRLVGDALIIPGLIKILDGYSTTSKLITDNFEVIEGNIYQDEEKPANFFPFPYDWRRDNRINAEILKRLLSKKLQKWRESENSEAKVVLLAHSMGGLISRYYIEVLGGWKDCRALFTFGTPYRGSLDAVNFIANGFKKASINLSEVMRSLLSVYQLLPTYEILQYEGKDYRLAEIPVALPNFNDKLLKDAAKFHNEISSAVETNKKEPGYSYITVPVLGIRQTTLQSAVLENGRVTTAATLPDILQGRLDLASGDGTVPEFSAYPPEFNPNDIFIARSIAEKHGALQAQEQILEDIKEILERYQFDTSKIKGSLRGRGKKAIDLLLEDVYFTDEEITITAKSNIDATNKLTASIICVSESREPVSQEFQKTNNIWTLTVKDLQPGLYQITVSDNSNEATSVNDLFLVSKKSDLQAL